MATSTTTTNGPATPQKAASTSSEVTAKAVYCDVESDVLAVIDISTYLIQSLDGLAGFDKAGASGLARILEALRDHAETVKNGFTEALQPQENAA